MSFYFQIDAKFFLQSLTSIEKLNIFGPKRKARDIQSNFAFKPSLSSTSLKLAQKSRHYSRSRSKKRVTGEENGEIEQLNKDIYNDIYNVLYKENEVIKKKKFITEQ